MCPPYLRTLLGIIQKHHELLETECHKLDVKIAQTLAKQNTPTDKTTKFVKYVSQLCTLENLKKKEEEEKETKLFRLEETSPIAVLTYKENIVKKLLSKLKKKLKKEIGQCEKSASLEARPGPVTANLDTVLNSHEIAMQAYHGRSFIGNHCHNFLQPHIYEELCDSVVAKTTTHVTCDNITEEAHAISSKSKELNKRFSAVHKEVSHSKLVTKEALASGNTISSYKRSEK